MIKAIQSSIKYQVRELSARLKVFLPRMCFWKWRRFSFQLSHEAPGTVHYLGPASDLPILKSLLSVSDTDGVESSEKGIKVSVYEFSVPDALRVPHYLSTIVALDQSMEDILAKYSRSLRRSTLKLAPQFRYEQVTTEQDVEHVNQTMLRPYAVARNGVDANHLPMSTVKDLALSDYGRLDLLYQQDKVVGCHLGNSYIRRGKRYWNVNRFGYVNEVYSNCGHLQDVNSANLHLALQYAIDSGYDYCDYGYSLARPGSGLIEWKRRRKGYLAKATAERFYVRVSKKDAPQFFWGSPLFSLEGKKIHLHLGVPKDKTDDELQARYREMGYDGLAKVHLMCASHPSEAFLEMIRGLYKEFSSQPEVVVTVKA